MSRFVIFSILFLGLNQIVFAKFPISQIPEELALNAKKVIRHSTYDVVCKSESKTSFRRSEAITFFKQNRNDQYITVHYDPSRKIKKIEAVIYDAEGKLVRKIKKKDIRDRSAVSNFSIYEDNRIKILDISHGILPFTVEYSYEIEITSQILYPVWDIQNDGTSIQYSEYIIRNPQHLDFDYKIFNLDVQPKKRTEKDVDIFHFLVKNLPAIKSEPNISEFNIYPFGLFKPARFSFEERVGDLTSWEKYGMFYKKLNDGRDELSPKMQQTVKELTSNAVSTREKIENLYSYIQKNMRYVSVQLGIGGLQTFDAKYVEENKYGDCKALSNFMKAMLKEVGIIAYPVLVYGDKNGAMKLDESFVFPLFNHVILYVPEEDCWLECTSTSNPAGHLGQFTSNRDILIITEAGGRLGRTPDTDFTTNQISRKSIFNILPNGQTKVIRTSVLKGNPIDPWIWTKTEQSEKELREFYIQTLHFSNAELLNLAFTSNNKKPEATIKSTLMLPRHISKAGKRLFIPLASDISKTVPKELENRKFPFELKNGYSITDSMVYHFPEGYRIETIPDISVTNESVFGKFKKEIIKTERSVIFIQKAEYYDGIFPPEQYEAYRIFLQKNQPETGSRKIVLVRDESIKRP